MVLPRVNPVSGGESVGLEGEEGFPVFLVGRDPLVRGRDVFEVVARPPAPGRFVGVVGKAGKEVGRFASGAQERDA